MDLINSPLLVSYNDISRPNAKLKALYSILIKLNTYLIIINRYY